MDIKQQVSSFTVLSHEDKKTKLIDMLTKLKETHEKFDMFYNTIKSSNAIPDKILIYIYKGILDIAQELKEGNDKMAQDKIEKISDILSNLKQQEIIDRKSEGDPDELLKDIE